MPRDRTLARENGSRLPTAWTLSSSSLKTATCSPSTSAATPALGTMSSSGQTRIAMASDLNGSRLPTAWTLSSSSLKTATCSPSTSAATPALGTMSSSGQTRIAMASDLNGSRLPTAWTLSSSSLKTATCSPSTSAATPALGTMSSSGQTRIAMASCSFKVRLPLFGPRRPDLPALGDELGADPQRVLAHRAAHVVDAAFQVLQPGAGALQPVAGADVEHQEAVDELNQFLIR